MKNNWSQIGAETVKFTRKEAKTVKEFCVYFGIARRTFYRWMYFLGENGFDVRKTNYGRPALYEVKK